MRRNQKVPVAALAALQSGKPNAAIAAELGIKLSTVHEYAYTARKAGLLGEVVPVDDAALIAGYLAGESVRAIARRLGIGRATAHARIHRLAAEGIIKKRGEAPPPPPVAAASPQDAFERVVELRGAGKTAKEIEAITGLSSGIVLNHIRSGIVAGVIERKVGKNADREGAVLALRDAGKSRREIGAELGLPEHTVQAVIGKAIEGGRTEPLPTERLRPQLTGKPAPARPRDGIVLAIIKRDGMDAAQERWPHLTIADLQRIKATAPDSFPKPTAEEAVAIVEEFLGTPAAVTHTLPPGYQADIRTVDTATAGDVIAAIERPITEADDDYLPLPMPEHQPPKGWSARIAASIARLFGGRS